MDESNLVTERLQNAIVTDANLIHYAAAAVMSKEMRKAFDKLLKSLNVETVAHKEPGVDDGAERR